MDFVSVRNFIELFKSTVNFIYSNTSLPFSDAYWLTLSGFIIFLALIWVLQEMTTVRILRYVILFIDIYDDLISRRVNSSDAEKFAEICPCCNGVGWGVIWGMVSFTFLCGSMYLGLVILS
ncbi:uncharacterized protein LOC133800752 isoform X2 [Humulus lupulus]|uniref:uncharacterized protein LOC133800752 isoform X2 n=1 Tax=Humulus lupulus TaxID=3486 RepID=UPI002B408953|nr:uncharacterized protein LOC133800752 isoform X2 [Humulus lupulus]